jgi:hypothetical protein
LEDSFAELHKILKAEEIEKMRKGAEADMIQYHFTLGMHLRNRWGLWSGSRLAKWFKNKGVSHPDDMSGIVLTSFWRHLNSRPIALDEQIKKWFLGVDEKIYHAKSGADLVRVLNASDEWLACSLIHKFGASEEGDVDAFLTDIQSHLPKDFRAKGEIYVFVDECHRTQSGKLHDAMKALLPGAMLIGFTGTPLLKDDKRRSIETFGPYIHTYKYDEAVGDRVGWTVTWPVSSAAVPRGISAPVSSLRIRSVAFEVRQAKTTGCPIAIASGEAVNSSMVGAGGSAGSTVTVAVR